MKRHNFIRRGLLLVLMIAMLSLPAYAAGTSLKIDAPASLPAVGETFTVKVDISGNPGLCAAQYTLAFDKTVVTCVSASVGDVLKGTLSAANPDAADGAIVAAAATSPAKGDGSIGVFTFKVLKSGETGFALKDGVFTPGHARAVLALPERALQDILFNAVMMRRLSVRDAEEAVIHWKRHGLLPSSLMGASAPVARSARAPKPACIKLAIRQLRENVAPKASISGTDRAGRITLPYESEEQLAELLSRLGLSVELSEAKPE